MAAAQTTQVVEHPAIAGLIAALDKGQADLAIAKIDGIESASGRPPLVATAAEFVRRMKGCKVIKAKARPYPPGSPYQFENSEWDCPDGPARVLFAAHPGASKVTIGEYSDAARVKFDASHVPSIIPPPPPSSTRAGEHQ
jgi:hypothetical protein